MNIEGILKLILRKLNASSPLAQPIYCTKLVFDFVYRTYIFLQNMAHFDDISDDNHLFFDVLFSHVLFGQGAATFSLSLSHFRYIYLESQLMNRCHFVI